MEDGPVVVESLQNLDKTRNNNPQHNETIQNLQAKVRELETQLRLQKHAGKLFLKPAENQDVSRQFASAPYSLQESLEIDMIEKEELRKALQSLEESVTKVEELTKSLLKRASILDEISNYIESKLIRGNGVIDIMKLRDQVLNLLDLLANTSKNELEVLFSFNISTRRDDIRSQRSKEIWKKNLLNTPS